LAESGTENATLTNITQTDESGRYRLEGVERGRFFIAAGRLDQQTFYPGATTGANATAVVVDRGASLTGLDFIVAERSAMPPAAERLSRALDSSVQAVDALSHIRLEPAGVPPPDYVVVDVMNRDVGRPIIFRARHFNAEGKFALSLPLGKSRIAVVLPPGYSVVSLTAGSADLLKELFDIPSGTNDLPEIVISIRADSLLPAPVNPGR
jgi:hypothetical protein